MIVCTVLSVKPYSGYYEACNICMGKVLLDQESRWWCRKCRGVISAGGVHERYCVAMTITDHTTQPQDTVVFGKSCDPLFGCSAHHLKKYIATCSDGSTHLHRAVTEMMVGRCFGFNFLIPPAYKHVTDNITLATIVDINTKLKRGLKRVELIAMEIRMLGSGLGTVLSRLQLWLDGTSHPVPISNLIESSAIVHGQSSNNNSNFFHEYGRSTSQACQGPSLLLETFIDSPQVSAAPLSTQTQSPPAAISTESTELEDQKDFVVSRTPSQSSLTDTSQAVADETIYEYHLDSARNESLLKELELDWELTQKHPSPSLAHTYSFSEEMLRELEEPFTQPIEPTPSLTTPHLSLRTTLSNTTITPASLSQGTSPELFSSDSNCSKVRESGVSMRCAPSFDDQWSSSPELFGSSLKKVTTEHKGSTDSQLTLRTPVLTARPHLPRRKLVQEAGTGTRGAISKLALTYHSPYEKKRIGEPQSHTSTYSPDIL